MKFYNDTEKKQYIESLKRDIIDDIKKQYNDDPFYDTFKVDINENEYFDRIVDYCRDNIREKCWSNCYTVGKKHKFYSSDGLAKKMERKFKWYVKNKWVKMAMICAGLEVESLSKSDGYCKRRYSNIDDIFDDDVVFCCRYVDNNELKLYCLNDYCV